MRSARRAVQSFRGHWSALPRHRCFSEHRSETIQGLLSKPEGQALIEALNKRPDRAYEFVLALTDNARRTIAVKAATAETSKNAAALSSALQEADSDGDGVLTRREFSKWLAAHSEAEVGGGATPVPTRRQLGLLWLNMAIPMVGFGFCDNAIMLVAGDAIDSSLGATLGLSMLASAALGNLVSDVAGIGMGDIVEGVAKRCGLPGPKLSPAQLAMTRTRLVAGSGGVLGISIGCLLGMVPLLFMVDETTKRATELFNQFDIDGDGVLSISELERIFIGLRIDDPGQAANAVCQSMGHKDASGQPTMNLANFLEHSGKAGVLAMAGR